MKLKLFIFSLLCCAYFLTAPRVVSISHDSVALLGSHLRAHHLSSFTPLSHIHELLTRRLIEWATNPFSQAIPVKEMITRQLIFNSVCVSLGLMIFFQICRRRLGLNLVSSVLVTMLLGVTFSTWQYRMTIENYALPVTAGLAFLYLALSPSFFKKSPFLIALLHIGLVFLHIRFAFMGFVFLSVGLYHKHYAWLFKYIGVSVILFCVGYAVFWAWAVPHSLLEMIYAFSPQVGAKEVYSVWMKIPLSIIGFGRSWISPNFLFLLPTIHDRFMSFFYLHDLMDEVFLVRHLASADIMILTVMLGIFMVLLMGIIGLSVARLFKGSNRQVLVVLLGFFCVDFALGLYTDPITVDQFVFSLPLFILLIGLGFSVNQWRHKYLMLIGLVGVLTLLNYYGSVRFSRYLSNDYYYSLISTGGNADTKEGRKINSYAYLFSQ